MEREPGLAVSEDLVAAAVDALNDIGNIVSSMFYPT